MWYWYTGVKTVRYWSLSKPYGKVSYILQCNSKLNCKEINAHLSCTAQSVKYVFYIINADTDIFEQAINVRLSLRPFTITFLWRQRCGLWHDKTQQDKFFVEISSSSPMVRLASTIGYTAPQKFAFNPHQPFNWSITTFPSMPLDNTWQQADNKFSTLVLHQEKEGLSAGQKPKCLLSGIKVEKCVKLTALTQSTSSYWSRSCPGCHFNSINSYLGKFTIIYPFSSLGNALKSLCTSLEWIKRKTAWQGTGIEFPHLHKSPLIKTLNMIFCHRHTHAVAHTHTLKSSREHVGL